MIKQPSNDWLKHEIKPSKNKLRTIEKKRRRLNHLKECEKYAHPAQRPGIMQEIHNLARELTILIDGRY